MKVLNVHRRTVHQPKEVVLELLNTLASREDKIWPHEKWPRMKLDKGLKVGSKGGHGPIRYFVNEYEPDKLIQFQFTNPSGFYGVHRLQLKASDPHKTTLIHTIEMKTSPQGTLKWMLFVRALHDALIEDAFDKVENYFDDQDRKSKWSLWVKFCRNVLTPNKK